MSLESLEGFFAALICGPDLVLPSEYLPQIWGDDSSFESDEQAHEILGLLIRHWNAISSALLGALEVPDVYLPVLLEDAQDVAGGNAWAQGFLRGVSARPASWRELLDSDEHGGPMLPIMVLAHEHDADPRMRPKPIAPDKREELLQLIIVSLTAIYRYFEPHRDCTAEPSDDAYEPRRRPGPKIGRNSLCPCGSGKKYKLCCGRAASALTAHQHERRQPIAKTRRRIGRPSAECQWSSLYPQRGPSRRPTELCRREAGHRDRGTAQPWVATSGPAQLNAARHVLPAGRTFRLHTMLGKANDRSLAQRLLSGSSEDLQAWLRLVAREGDVQGLAELERDDLEHPPTP